MTDEKGFVLRRAGTEDLPSILAVMQHYNMHEVPGAEKAQPLRPELFFLALVDGEVAGAAGWMIESPERARTTLLSVNPAFGRRGIGAALQTARLKVMKAAGVQTVTTNTDRQDSVDWYIRHFGYVNTGRIKPKKAPFGAPLPYWITLELDLAKWEPNPEHEQEIR